MKQEILSYLLGDLTLSFLAGFYIFALLGVIFSMLLHFGKKQNKTKAPFNFGFWVADNAVRLLMSIISIFIIARFKNELPIDLDLNMWLGLLIGASLDQIIIVLRNKTKINIFQK